MNYVYTTDATRRIVLSHAETTTRLCLPIPEDLYPALVRMSQEELEEIEVCFQAALREAFRAWELEQAISQIPPAIVLRVPHAWPEEEDER